MAAGTFIALFLLTATIIFCVSKIFFTTKKITQLCNSLADAKDIISKGLTVVGLHNLLVKLQRKFPHKNSHYISLTEDVKTQFTIYTGDKKLFYTLDKDDYEKTLDELEQELFTMIEEDIKNIKNSKK